MLSLIRERIVLGFMARPSSSRVGRAVVVDAVADQAAAAREGPVVEIHGVGGAGAWQHEAGVEVDEMCVRSGGAAPGRPALVDAVRLVADGARRPGREVAAVSAARGGRAQRARAEALVAEDARALVAAVAQRVRLVALGGVVGGLVTLLQDGRVRGAVRSAGASLIVGMAGGAVDHLRRAHRRTQ